MMINYRKKGDVEYGIEMFDKSIGRKGHYKA